MTWSGLALAGVRRVDERLGGGVAHFDGKCFATAGEDGGLHIITLGKRGEEVPMAAFPGTIHDIVFAKDNRHLITANANGTVYIIRLPALDQ